MVSTPENAPLFPLRDVWIAAFPLLPLIVFTVGLSGLIDFQQEHLDFLTFDFERQYMDPLLRNYTHIGDLLVYYSIALLHVFICLFVIVFFIHVTRVLPQRERIASGIFLAVALAFLLVLIFCFSKWANDIVLVQLGFKATCVAIDGANLATRLIETGACFKDGHISRLTWLAWIPTFAGMGATLFAAAFAYGNARGLPGHDDPAWKTVIEQRLKSLQRSVYALSAVLVSSTITIILFAALPTHLFGPKGGALAKAMSAYVSGLSTFWGVLFTLTLAATFAVPAFRILRQAYRHDTAVTEAEDLRVWLREHVFVSFKKQFSNVLVVLAPLLTGSFSSIASFLIGR